MTEQTSKEVGSTKFDDGGIEWHDRPTSPGLWFYQGKLLYFDAAAVAMEQRMAGSGELSLRQLGGSQYCRIATTPSPAAALPADAEQLAREFHEIYEQLAPSFGYATREETRQFDPTSPNGRLMIAVCDHLLARGHKLSGGASNEDARVRAASDTQPVASSLHKDIAAVLNSYSAENESGTPDFILARYLLDCLKSFETAVSERRLWYGETARTEVLATEVAGGIPR